MTELERIVEALLDAGRPMTTPELVESLGADAKVVDKVLWDNPDRFAWQPGHRWTLALTRPRPSTRGAKVEDVRASPLVPPAPRQLRAITLASGLTIRVTKRAMDTDSFFAVKSVGSVLELTLNSSHELFSSLPMPFEAATSDDGDLGIAEVLLAAWALHEDATPDGPHRRALQDARYYWGRRSIEMLRDAD